MRFIEIERENRKLLEKMSNIMQKDSAMYSGRKFLKKLKLVEPMMKKSLNRDFRRKQLIKISNEN